MIIYPHVNADTLNALGTKICGLIRESSYPFEGKELPVSVSVGGAMPQPGDSKGSLLIRLDKNLYISKHNNKNCSTVL